MMCMYNVLKKTILYTLTFILLLLLAGAVCYADELPHTYDIFDDVPIFVNDQLVSDTAIIQQGNIYLNIATVQKYGQTSFLTFDTAVNKILFNVADIDIFVVDQETTDYLKANAGEMMLPIRYFGAPRRINTVSLVSISQLCKLDYRYENGCVFLYPYTGTEVDAPESHKYNIYYEAKPKDTFDTKINLVWQMVYDPGYKTTDGREIVWGDTNIPPTANDDIDVLSPMWLRTETWSDGFIVNRCDAGYVQLAHAAGMKVWICATNGFTKDSDEIMINEAYRSKAVSQLVLCTLLSHADGINIDFESMGNDIIWTAYTDFVIELYKLTDKTGLTLSLATMLASDYWASIFNFAVLGENADYICPMTYNEHWKLSVGPGSTMSKSYYTKNTDNLIKYVPPEKILMGVPLYTQVWEVTSSGEPKYLWTVPAWRQIELLAEREITPVWNDEDAQFVAAYPGQDHPSNTIMIWVEDERSMANKLAYVLDRGIAGTACWAMGQQYDGMMEVFGKVYKQGVDPMDIPGYYYDPNFVPATQPAAGGDTQQEQPGDDTQQEQPGDDTQQQVPGDDTQQQVPGDDTQQQQPGDDTQQQQPGDDTQQQQPGDDTQQQPGDDTQQGGDQPSDTGQEAAASKYRKGDFNGDGVINAYDLTALSRFVAHIVSIDDPDILEAGDVDCSGRVDANDLIQLSRYVAMIVDHFEPVQKPKDQDGQA